MATERKFLWLNTTSGYIEDQGSNGLELPNLDLNSDLNMDSNEITNMGAATEAGDVLLYDQACTLGVITVSSDIAFSGSYKVTGMGSGTDTTDAVTKDQLDAAEQGMAWKDPVTTINIVDDSLTTAPSLIAGDAGESYVVAGTGGGWSGFEVGDLVEWDGSTWVELVGQSGGYVPSGTRCVVTTTETAAGNLAGEEGEIATADGAGDWTFYDPSDGDGVLVADSDSIYDNLAYHWDQPSTTWIQFTGANNLSAGDGITKPSSTEMALDYQATSFTIASDYLKVNIDTSYGLQFDSGGVNDKKLELNVGASGGLEISTGLKTKLATTAGLIADDTNGIQVQVYDSPYDTLDLGSGGLNVTGLGEDFTIDDVATDTDYVTAGNLDTLCDGSVADGLHHHSAAEEATRIEYDYTATSALTKGDPVYLDATNNQVGKSLATDDAKGWVFGVARTDIPQDSSGPIVGPGLAEGVLTSATAGDLYYLADAGGLQADDPPSTSGSRRVLVGIAKNATDLLVMPHYFGKNS